MSTKRVFAIGFSLLLMVMSILVTRAQDGGCDPAVNTANQGDVLLAAGNYAGAVSTYTCALQTRPDSAALYNARGNAYRHLKNYAQALVDYNRAIELAPSVAMFYNNRGFVEYKQGSLATALADFNRSIELDAYLAYPYNNRGLIYALEGQNDLAAADFSKAISLGHVPLSWPMRNLADLHVDVPMPGVLTHYVHEPEIPPDQQDLYDAAQDAFDAEDFAKAIDLYGQLIALDPENSLYFSGRGASHYKIGDFQHAAEDYTGALKTQPTSFYLLWRANSYAFLQQTDKALSDYADAIRIEPTFLNAYLYRALLYHQIGDDTSSRDDFKVWFTGNSTASQFVPHDLPESGQTISLEMTHYHYYSFKLPVKKGQVLTIETATASDSKVDPMLVLVESGVPQVINDDGLPHLNAAITKFVVPGDCVYDLYLVHPGTPGSLDLTITIANS